MMLDEGIWKDIKLMYDKAVGDNVTQGWDKIRKGLRGVLKYWSLNSEQRDALEIMEHEFEKSYQKMIRLKYAKENIKKAVEPYWKRDYDLLKAAYDSTVLKIDSVISSLNIEKIEYDGADYHNHRRLAGITTDTEDGLKRGPAVEGWSVVLSYRVKGQKKEMPKKYGFAYSERAKGSDSTVYIMTEDPEKRKFYNFSDIEDYYANNRAEVVGWYRDKIFGNGDGEDKYQLFRAMSATIRDNAIKDLKTARKSGMAESIIGSINESDEAIWKDELMKLKKVYVDFKKYLDEEYLDAQRNVKSGMKRIHTLFKKKDAGYTKKKDFQKRKEKEREKQDRKSKFSDSAEKRKGKTEPKEEAPKQDSPTADKKRSDKEGINKDSTASEKQPETTKPSANAEKGSETSGGNAESTPKSNDAPKKGEDGKKESRIAYLSKPIDFDQGIFLPPSDKPNDGSYFAMDTDTGLFWLIDHPSVTAKLKQYGGNEFLKILNMNDVSLKKYSDREYSVIRRIKSGRLEKMDDGNWKLKQPAWVDGEMQDFKPEVRLYSKANESLISEALEFPKEAETLCPKVFNRDAEMKADIKILALSYALDMIGEAKLSDIGAKPIDIWLTGSLAGYRYRKESDFDLHIILDMEGTELMEAEMYLKAKAKELNADPNRLYIEGHPVEIYYQPSEEPHHSDGIYSIYRGKWVKTPTKNNEGEVEEGYDKAENYIKTFIKILEGYLISKDIAQFQKKLDDTLTAFLKTRKDSLNSTDDELNSDNVAFKILRNAEIIDGLNALRKKAKYITYTI